MLELLQHPDYGVFYTCLAVVLLIGAVELLGFVIGATISNLIDSVVGWDIDFDIDVGGHAPGTVLSALGWLSFGKIPFMMVVIIFLTSFALCGLIIQETTDSLFGFYWPQFLAGSASFVASVPILHFIGDWIARIMPKVETSAISSNTFVGNTATVTGRAVGRVNKPTEAKFVDVHGQVHYILVQPASEEYTLNHGDSVTLLESRGPTFIASINRN